MLGSTPPVGFTYELFLDEHSQKISKSKGNGLSVEEWLRYAPPESLAQFMYNAPQRAKRLFFDVIPRAVDEFIANAAKLPAQDAAAQLRQPGLAHPAAAATQDYASPVPFGMLLNLASVVNAETPDMLWGFLRRYSPEAAPGGSPFFDGLVGSRHRATTRTSCARRSGSARRTPFERAALRGPGRRRCARCRRAPTPEAIQDVVYEVGKRHPFPELKAWFGCLYQVLLGQTEGPRFGGFIALYGVAETIALIEAQARPAAADAA